MTQDEIMKPLPSIETDAEAVAAMLQTVREMCIAMGSLAEARLGIPVQDRRILTREVKREQRRLTPSK